MNAIAGMHAEVSPDHPVAQLWLHPSDGVIAKVQTHLAELGVHPAHAVVLVPYAQLMPAARRWWAKAVPQGFAPRFETTLNWAARLGPTGPAEGDITFDVAQDLLRAHTLLEQAGLSAWQAMLAPRLVEAAHQLGRCVAAVPVVDRAEWGEQARTVATLSMDAPALALEAAVARIALEWALASSYATDVLFEALDRPVEAGGAAALIVLGGFVGESLTQALRAQWGERCAVVPLVPQAQADNAGAWRPEALDAVQCHAARDAEDEAERAAACVLRHIAQGRAPVALVATDRALTRRIRAMLDAQGVTVRDESGWKLSTTRAASHVMSALRACVWDASCDTVLDWLKNTPVAPASGLQALERALRKAGARDWRGWMASGAPVLPERAAETGASSAVPRREESVTTLSAWVQAQVEPMRASRPLHHWLTALRALLQSSGHWDALVGDAAGEKVRQVLRLDEAATAAWAQQLSASAWGTRRLDLDEFTTWVKASLEAGSFVPEYPLLEQAVILPISQLLGRAFGAVVLPASDEKRLAAAPEPTGQWTPRQRDALGLPTRAALQQELRAAWSHALKTPCVDVLWRHADEGGEALLPSPLVQELLGQSRDAPQSAPHPAVYPAADPRAKRELAWTPEVPPQPSGQALPVKRLSASAYEDLRRCPYRFFALRMLGLSESDELDAELDKRDFGLWLHAVLRQFHETHRDLWLGELSDRADALEAAAQEVTRRMGLSPAEFLPFAAAWPQVREGYLAWLAKAQEQQGLRFESAEQWLERSLGPLQLVGQIDRIDALQADDMGDAGGARLIDYKTESLSTTQARVKDPGEDTQLAFYAALMPDRAVQAAYVNVGEKTGTRLVDQPELAAAREALCKGMLSDTSRIAAGHALRALGEGAVCDYCAARGLCRKDFWSLPR